MLGRKCPKCGRRMKKERGVWEDEEKARKTGCAFCGAVAGIRWVCHNCGYMGPPD